MGIGKSSTCKELNKRVDRSVWLDGDWCWMMNPWIVNEENKKMVEDNIVFLLKNFLANSNFEYVIFNWVIHREEIFKRILDRLENYKFQLYKITLSCSEKALIKRMKDDNRSSEAIEVSLQRLKAYEIMETIKIDTTNRTIQETVDKIIEIVD
ncbi:AAA family ATPase [Wukongibacter baidiensis]|uniref:AAA family ATPase n=1 Tax=Wukongibacter baidiensis TaxID=1723361 RepID=UPI003D7F7D4B